MNGIFNFGPTMPFLFQIYLTESVQRHVKRSNVGISTKCQPTLVIKHSCQEQDDEYVETTQAVVNPGNEAPSNCVQLREALRVCKK